LGVAGLKYFFPPQTRLRHSRQSKRQNEDDGSDR
jgi:hypothetical protein